MDWNWWLGQTAFRFGSDFCFIGCVRLTAAESGTQNFFRDGLKERSPKWIGSTQPYSKVVRWENRHRNKYIQMHYSSTIFEKLDWPLGDAFSSFSSDLQIYKEVTRRGFKACTKRCGIGFSVAGPDCAFRFQIVGRTRARPEQKSPR